MDRMSADSPDVTMNKLLQDLRVVVEDAETLLKATANQAGEKIQEARARASESIATARVRLVELEKTAMRRARELATEGDVYVHENPWTAVGVAAGVGVLLGVLLSRR
jgi:ElaB/YqjD/DUF883 family membrane-anchored ribosome-binding protein